MHVIWEYIDFMIIMINITLILILKDALYTLSSYGSFRNNKMNEILAINVCVAINIENMDIFLCFFNDFGYDRNESDIL